MKRRQLELKVPVKYRQAMTSQLHEVIEQMISYGMPAYIREKKGIFNTTFFLIYLPVTNDHILQVDEFEKQTKDILRTVDGARLC